MSVFSKSTLKLISEYFINSDQKLKAWLLLGAVILSTVAMTALLAVFPMWNATFWIAIGAKNIAMILVSLNYFLAILLSTCCVVGLKNYFQQILIVNWQKWLTDFFIKKYMSGQQHNYLDLSRFANILSNPAQRIQEDVEFFVKNTVDLGLEFFSNVISLGYFTYSLWIIGGALSFVVFGMNFVIPGYLVWTALAFCTVTTVLTRFISRHLDTLNSQKFSLKDNLRQGLQIVGNEAENVALEHSKNYYINKLITKLHMVIDNAFHISMFTSIISSVQMFIMQLQMVFPYVIALPVLFSGRIDMPLFMQISMAFGQVSSALSWFSLSANRVGLYRTNIERINELNQALHGGFENESDKKIAIQHVAASKNINLVDIKITKPTNNEVLMQGLNLEFKQGEHTLIKGVSGLGKSTLFKIISGTWQYGDGIINRPDNISLFYLTQKPIIPTDTLKAVLAYPRDVSLYNDEQFKEVLEAVGLHKFTNRLNEEQSWYKQLSGGEQQKIAFARAILAKPDWLFMDETTAALDEANEASLYKLLKEKLPKATIVSIAHRSTVEQFHDRVITLSLCDPNDPTKKISISDSKAMKPHNNVLKPELKLAAGAEKLSEPREKSSSLPERKIANNGIYNSPLIRSLR